MHLVGGWQVHPSRYPLSAYQASLQCACIEACPTQCSLIGWKQPPVPGCPRLTAEGPGRGTGQPISLARPPSRKFFLIVPHKFKNGVVGRRLSVEQLSEKQIHNNGLVELTSVFGDTTGAEGAKFVAGLFVFSDYLPQSTLQ